MPQYGTIRASIGPENLDLVGGKLPVSGENVETFKLGLGNQETIERVCMMQRQGRHVERMCVEDG